MNPPHQFDINLYIDLNVTNFVCAYAYRLHRGRSVGIILVRPRDHKNFITGVVNKVQAMTLSLFG